ncbi:hypothetical protein G4422_10825 [Blautia wexlerae]|nr:hypothetical protein [Blautia wexlerae]NSF77711.1 hypothetical protein [Blautia wexlerae]
MISAYEKSGAEVIVMGRGIGFKKKQGEIKVAIGLVASAALCAFICGVTEPFEFGFMFLTLGLYVIYALLYGIFTVVTVLLGFRAGFSFSAGVIRSGKNSVQVVIGTKVQFVADEFKKLCK